MPIQKFENVAPDLPAQAWSLFTNMDVGDPTAASATCKSLTNHPLELQSLGAECTSNAIENLTSFIRTHCTLRAVEGVDQDAQFQTLDEIASKSYLGSRIVQSRASEIQKRTSDLVPKDQILVSPLPTFGVLETLDPQSMKLIPVFKGDDKSPQTNAKLFQEFIRSLFDQVRGKVTKPVARDCLIKKLAGSAVALVDRKILEHSSPEGTPDPTRPTFEEIVSLLENRYLSTLTPALALHRLNMIKRDQGETLSSLEARINELCRIAAQQEVPATRLHFIQMHELSAFRSAISTRLRNILDSQDKTRLAAGLPVLTLQESSIFYLAGK